MPLPLTDRTIISGGPGIVRYQGATFYSAEPFTLETGIKTFPIPSDAYGPLDSRIDDDEFSMSMKLVGEWEHLDVLYPYLTTPVGTLIFGVDVPLDIISLTDDKMFRFHASAITKMPNLNLAPTQTLLEEVTFRFVRKNLTARDDADALYTEYDLTDGTVTLTYGSATGALAFNTTAAQLSVALNALAAIISDGGVTVTGDHRTGFIVTWVTVGVRATALTGVAAAFPDASTVAVSVTTAGSVSVKEKRLIKVEPWATYYGAINIASIITQPYELIWTPWGSFGTQGGCKVNFSEQWEDRVTDVDGVSNIRFMGLAVNAEFVPDGITATQALAAGVFQGTGAVRGRSLNAGSADLDITNTGVFIRLYGANLSK